MSINHNHEETDTNFNVNGDFSGDVRIDLPVAEADVQLMHLPSEERVAIRVPFEALEWFVAQKYWQENLVRAENADPVDVMRVALEGSYILLKPETYLTDDPYARFIHWVKDTADDPEKRRTMTLNDIQDKANEAIKEVYGDDA